MYRIQELQIKDFRGFREAHFSIPDVDIVLVAGGNGFGKSSFFDAIEWGLTGSLRRYAESNQEKSSEIFLTNRYSHRRGQVKMVLTDGQDTVTLVRKTKTRRGNDFNQGELEGLTQSALEHTLVKEPFVGKYDFTRIFNFSHLMSQELIDEFVRGFKATDRYDVLSHLIGIQDYTNYHDRLRLFEREVRQSLDTLHREILGLNKDQEKYEELVNQETGELSDVDNRWAQLVQQYHELLKEVNTDSEESKPNVKTEFTDRKQFIAQLLVLNDLYSTRIKARKNTYHKLIDLQTQLPTYQCQLQERERIQQERWQLWERSERLQRLAILQFIIEHFNAYRSYSSDQERLIAIDKEMKQLETAMQILQRNELEIVDIVFILEKVLTDPTLQTYAIQIRDLQAEKNEVEEQWRMLNKLIDELNHIETDILQRTLRYFVLNPEIEQCPVCKAEIDPRLLMAQLNARIESEQPEIVKVQIDRRNSLQEELTQVRKRFDDLIAVVQDYLRTLIVAQREQWQCRLEEKEQRELAVKQASEVQKNLLELGIHQPAGDELLAEVQRQHTVLEQMVNPLGLSREQIRSRMIEVEKEEQASTAQILQFERELRTFGLQEIGQHSLEIMLQGIEAEITTLESGLTRVQWMMTEVEAILFQIRNSANRENLQKTQDKLAQLQHKALELESLQKSLKDLESQVPVVLKDMTMGVLDHYKETVNEFLHLLNPQPFFSQLDWEVSHSHFNNGTLILQSISGDGKYRMNPSFTYSSAQINLIALSFFLSFAVQQRWSNLECMFMDDPIQNMDDINIFGFVDLIRALCLNGHVHKQIFISTHDRKFVNFMLKKFRMLRVFLIDYKGYGERGPVIETKMYEPKNKLSIR